ncbi:MAG: glycosyltransferase family 4 protein [Phycisphaerae bacterium]|nr:glycosyltransferase family 4 protein [Phycisphaerae bacterium]
MKVFMLGWEFPPFISGGLGTACYGLSKAMSQMGTQITFVLPRTSSGGSCCPVKILSTEGCIQANEFENVSFRPIASSLAPYATCGTSEGCRPQKNNFSVFSWQCASSKCSGNYGGDIYEQVYRYASKAVEIADLEDFDLIHAHDWMTYPAAIAVAESRRKPLIVHVHSTEFDRSGENVNQTIYNVERAGMHIANKVVAVSQYTKNIIMRHYGVSSGKIETVYNGVECNGSSHGQVVKDFSDKIVLFLGRLTLQKGPEYFIAAAKKVLEVEENVKFIMAGDGDMTHRMIEYAASLGIGHKVFFTGFLRGADVDRAYEMADLYVMPSVSEPFGIAPLEALKHEVPVLISKQSGVSEVLQHALKADFWDIDELANKIVSVLRYPPLRTTLRENGHTEVETIRWEDSAAKVTAIYKQLLACA